MPKTTFKSVREVSSEDANYKAENLLKQTPGKSWKTKTVGEKQAYVILELESSEQITGIDIGNEHSAFIEVLVGKAACTSENFTEILITCSFMTPLESRSSDNPNRVRCFNTEVLVPSIAEQKWQMVKVICTQPFNKHVQYGLAFIKLHVAEKAGAKLTQKPINLVPEKFLKQITFKETESTKQLSSSSSPLTSIKIGKFTLREDSPDSESESTNALFQRWKNNNHTTAPTTAAAIRDASSPAALKKMSEAAPRAKIPIKPVKALDAPIDVEFEDKRYEIRDRNRMDLLFGDDEENKEELTKRQRLSKHIEQDKERVKHESEVQQLQHKTTKISKPSSDDVPSTSKAGLQATPKPKQALNSSSKTTLNNSLLNNSNSSNDRNHARKRHSSPPQISGSTKKQKTTQIIYKPFNELLKGVVLVISGIQNPDRADLRDKALEMGAKYRGDWGGTCTHLM